MKKRLFGLILALCMICGSLTNASAANVNFVENSGTSAQPTLTPTSTPAIQPFAWNGTAAQVTRIELDGRGWLPNGNWGVRLKVTGYGSDMRRSFFNGNPVSSKNDGYFINYGNCADGFYYLYDCGPITAAGTYTFKTTFRSTNSPYSERTFSCDFTFAQVQQ